MTQRLTRNVFICACRRVAGVLGLSAGLILVVPPAIARTLPEDQLSVRFAGKRGQVEVGGPFAGLEFHDSRPLPSRISFYYPVANSIDVSTDYWQRGDSRPMAISLRRGDEPWKAIGTNPWVYTLSPHRVEFTASDRGMVYRLSYEFCKNLPACVQRLTIRNGNKVPVPLEVSTHLLFAVRTCQTYRRLDSAWTMHDPTSGTLAAHVDDPTANGACFFVTDCGQRAVDWGSDALYLGISDSGTSVRKDSLGMRQLSQANRGPAAAAFLYRRTISPGDSLSIVHVIGSCKGEELGQVSSSLAISWKAEVDEYNTFVSNYASKGAIFRSGNDEIDRTAAWARGILATNAHNIDGTVVPMPCPAEYNFFFTHDVLVTDLGAVQYDTERVRRDLLYIASHARGDIIPHAYYWRDDGFKTEYCEPDSWNHLWFILLTASYLRHSLDDSTCNALLPLVTKSLHEVLSQKSDDNLMIGYRPDWWDIGHVEGARAYLSILTIRALHDYLYLRSYLRASTDSLSELESTADALQRALDSTLWSSQYGYLMNTVGDSLDPHYYMGSLLAIPFGILDARRADTLLATATRELFDKNLGLRNAAPIDFHTQASKSFYQFAGDEAGQPFYYMNGGIWSHANAWYVLAQLYSGNNVDALRVLKSTMTIDGITHSPNGQPALYEYRFTDPQSPRYGTIDKPSFLWAGGYFLYTIYQLYGSRENVWNLSYAAPAPDEGDIEYTAAFGKTASVQFTGTGNPVALSIDGSIVPTAVLPLTASGAGTILVRRSPSRTLYLRKVNAILHSVRWDERGKALEITVSSFPGHNTEAAVVTPITPTGITIDGKTVSRASIRTFRREQEITIRFEGSEGLQVIRIDLG